VIARVRIAPVERWCGYYRERWDADEAIVGRRVEILTETCTTAPLLCDSDHPAGTRWWNLSEQQAKRTFEYHGQPDDGGRCLCEHVLEMD
jgi:hypothetical protein